MLHCAFLDWLLTCPLLCMSRSSFTLSWRSGRFPCTIEILHLQSIDQVLDVPVVQVQVFSGAGCEKLVEIPQLQPLILDTVVHLPVVCNDRCRMVQTTRKLRRSRSCNTYEPVVDVPLVPVCWYSSSKGVDVPVITQRQLYSGRASDSVHHQSRGQTSCATVLVLPFSNGGLCGDEWVFVAFCVIFRAPPVVPELSASFFRAFERSQL